MAYNVHIKNIEGGVNEFTTHSPLSLDEMLRTMIDADGPDWSLKLLLDGVYVGQSGDFDAIIHAITQEARDALDGVIAKCAELNTGLVEDMEAENEEDFVMLSGSKYIED